MSIAIILAALCISKLAWGSAAVLIPGLWVSHGQWVAAPAEVVEDRESEWWAPATLINFCPDGKLHLASGVLYKNATGAGLGASDGLAIYRGEWMTHDGTIIAKYRLESSEIAIQDNKPAKPPEFVTYPRIEDGALYFDFHRAFSATAASLRLVQVDKSGYQIDDTLLECKRG